jgi:pimeloyl-ACP methyl ester carboxylesterase
MISNICPSAWKLAFSIVAIVVSFLGGATTAGALTNPVSLGVTLEGAGQGRVTSDPSGVDCPTDCTNSYTAGRLVSLFATPAAGSRFSGWDGACKSFTGPLCTLKLTKNRNASARFVKDLRTHTKVKALLLLHGLNSSLETWNEFVRLRFNDRCARIYGGVVMDADATNNVLCYRMNFGAYDDLSGRKGLEGLTPAQVRSAGQLPAGDFSTFRQLGNEVRAAILGILGRHPKAAIVILGHSRGGLAARSFLQKDVPERNVLIGLLTTGTPHLGSPLGRIYQYLKEHPRNTCNNNACEEDWAVVDFLRDNFFTDTSKANLDVRKPAIGDLADDSAAIANLNSAIGFLPTGIAYGQLVYSGTDLGILAKTPSPFPDCSIFRDDFACPDVSRQAEDFLLGKAGNPDDFPGDGIVPFPNQYYFGIPNFPAAAKNRTSRAGKTGTLHTEESQKESDISNTLSAMMGAWWNPLATAKAAEATTSDEGYKRLHADAPVKLWERWRDLLARQDWSQLPIVSAALAERLRESGNETIYHEITGLLQQPELPMEQKAAVIDLLREIATPKSLGLLLETASSASDPRLRKAATQGIARIGDNRWDARFHEELSPLLESAWSDGDIKDKALLTAVALSMAKIGAPNGVDLLLNTLSEKTSMQEDSRLAGAVMALGEIHNPGAVPVLSQRLQRHSMDEPVFKISGETLAKLGSPEATQVLLDWARNAPAEAAPLLGAWFQGMHDSDSIRLLREAVSKDKHFQSPKVREAIAPVLKQYRPKDGD